MKLMVRLVILLLLCVACNSVHQQYKGYYKIGSKYTIGGETYYPKYYDEYSEVGMASWYSDDCYKCKDKESCGKCVTANGEIFNKNLLTAAHRTLPMPSMIRVVNLDNGKSIVLKVNDRGPFKNNRILDVSEKAAEELGFKKQGLAMVRVEYLKHATDKLIDSKMHYKRSYRRTVKNNYIFSMHEPVSTPIAMHEGHLYIPQKKKFINDIKSIYSIPAVMQQDILSGDLIPRKKNIIQINYTAKPKATLKQVTFKKYKDKVLVPHQKKKSSF